MGNGGFLYWVSCTCLPAALFPAHPGRAAHRNRLLPQQRRSKQREKSLRNPPETFSKQQTYAFLAISMSWVKAAGSLIAISESILRFRVMPAFFRPFIKVE